MAEMVHVVCPHCDAVNQLPGAKLSAHPNCGRCKKALFTGEPVALDAARFETHLARSDLPLIADFWAEWCAPCRAMAPIFEKAAAEFEPKARFVKIDVDANPQLAARYDVRGIPALFAFKRGQVAARHAGLADGVLMREWIERLAPAEA